MRDVAVVGAGMTRFDKHLARSIKEIAAEAVQAAESSAGIERRDIQAAVVGNSVLGLITGQEAVRGQVMLRKIGFRGIPIINTENACASSSTAFHVAWLYVASGLYDCVLALGAEKLLHQDRRVSFAAIGGTMDLDEIPDSIRKAREGMLQSSTATAGAEAGAGLGATTNPFMPFYAAYARRYMDQYGVTKEVFAKVAVKNRANGALNPHARYQEPCTLEDVLLSPVIIEPLTRMMCCPLSDGAAALVLTSPEKARQLGSRAVWVAASELNSGEEDDQARGRGPVIQAATRAYESSGIGPSDIDVIEVHDATASAEIFAYEELGLAARGEGWRLIEDGATRLDGRQPVNTSGGLLAKGHPFGATGTAQIVEIFHQLRGEAGRRQVPDTKVGLTHNAGGMVLGEYAATSVHIFKA